MPKKTDNSAVETEKGFGTGLRRKLERRHPDAPEPVVEAEELVEAEAADEAEPPTASETEQLWSELEESLAREDELKQTLAERAEADKRNAELARTLTARAEALEERERRLAEQLGAAQQEAAPAEGQPKKAPKNRETGRTHLRRRAAENADLVWRVFQEGLTATKPSGEPDYRTRLMAAKALLAEAYGELDTGGMSPGEQVEAARDELAGMRAKRASKPR